MWNRTDMNKKIFTVNLHKLFNIVQYAYIMGTLVFLTDQCSGTRLTNELEREKFPDTAAIFTTDKIFT